MPNEPPRPMPPDALTELWHERLRRMLDRAGISNGEVAGRLDVAPETVSRWRSGQAEIRRRDLRLVLQLLAERGIVLTEEWVRSGNTTPAQAAKADPFGDGSDMGVPNLPIREEPDSESEKAGTKAARRRKRAG